MLSGLFRGVTTQAAILEVLMRGPNYGVGIRETVLERTGWELGPGTLYPALRSLERDGFLRSWEGEPTAERGGRAKVMYELTAEGRRAANEARSTVVGMYGLGALGVAGG